MGFDPKRFKQYLLTGVSYAIPFVACGGILIALTIAFVPMVPGVGPDFTGHPWLEMANEIGGAAFGFLVPVLAGYIAFGIADRPGLVPGMVGGYIATHLAPATKLVALAGHPDTFTLVQLTKSPNPLKEGAFTSAGFLGGLVAGLLAGFVALQIKRLKVPPYIKPIMPILIIPVVSSLVVGFLMYKVVGFPVAAAMDHVGYYLQNMQGGAPWLLALVLGAMIAFDMGGPINKVAFFFSAALIEKGIYAPMGACAAAICIPPIGLGLATLVRKKNWTEEEREAGVASLAMGCIGITEGAIPFAAGDPIRVIPSIMIGSMIGAVIAMVSHVGDHAPHGGPIVLPVIDNRPMFIVAILAGTVAVAVIINVLKSLGQKANTEEAKV
jgi:fructose-specific phosphotransferase system IIC component